MAKAPDDEQLAFASVEGRIVITANQGDFAALHWAWSADHRSHAGIVIVPQLMELRIKLGRLAGMFFFHEQDYFINRLEYLSSWPDELDVL
ncbi:hypothetical protein AYO38_03635 [bacterium SCGC AG-212-C10]|nr:hypothetical protein AYO38_03635 [bacterium SCGC AG-212-C10]